MCPFAIVQNIYIYTEQDAREKRGIRSDIFLPVLVYLLLRPVL